jgi:maleate isomerase
VSTVGSSESAGVGRVGIITPSSNTVLEPVMSRMAARSVPALELHYSRIAVTAIDLTRPRLSQFDVTPMVSAARMLSDAGPRGIVWAGTSGGWLGA